MENINEPIDLFLGVLDEEFEPTCLICDYIAEPDIEF